MQLVLLCSGQYETNSIIRVKGQWIQKRMALFGYEKTRLSISREHGRHSSCLRQKEQANRKVFMIKLERLCVCVYHMLISPIEQSL